MAEEKKIDLSALGLEQEITPADKAADNASKQEIHNEVVDTKVIKDQDKELKIEVVKSDIDPSKIKPDIEAKPEPLKDKAGNVIKVVRPVGNSGEAGYNNDYTEITDINSIAKNPITKKKDPVRETLNGLYAKADDGIERAKAEATKPGGRIDEAKHKYIDHQYNLLMKRANGSKSLKKKIDTVNEIIQTDPRFDGITEYEHKAYIVFKVAHDEQVGINDDSFGISNANVGTRYRNSADAAKALDKMVSNKQETEFDDNKFVISNDEGSSTLPVRDDIDKKKEEDTIKPESEVPTTVVQEEESSIPVKEEEPVETEEDNITESNIDTEDEELIQDEEESTLEEQERRALVKKRTEEFVEQVDDLLGIKKFDNVLADYQVGAPISLSTAIKHRKNPAQGVSRATWGLQFTGTSFDMTKFYNEELQQFQKDEEEIEKFSTLYTLFHTMYNHVIIPKKPKFETWLKQISNYDISCLMFGMYLACYGHTNYMPYECPNGKCSKIFLEKKDPLDMVIFPSEESKKRFQTILSKESVSTMLYRTKPMMINEQYSISFMTPSIYSGTFEPAALSTEIKDKFTSLTTIMPYIDCIYLNDNEHKTLNRIMFGVIENDIEKTTLRRFKGLASIFKTFSMDELNRISLEVGKIAASLNEEQIAYQIPATTCPDCKTQIAAVPRGPLQLLFTRAQLLITKAIIPELT